MAAQTPFPHNAIMAEEHPYSYGIAPDTRDKDMFGWIITENGEDRNFSTRSYKTYAEAEADAYARMQQLIASWRIGKDQ
jgi:hypothetical protein